MRLFCIPYIGYNDSMGGWRAMGRHIWLRAAALPLLGLTVFSGIWLAVSGIGEDSWFQAWESWDRTVYEWITAYQSPYLRELAVWMDFLGSAVGELLVLAVAVPILVFFWKKYAEAAAMLLAYGGGWWLNHGLKELFGRTRPEAGNGFPTVGFSFPSGHAMVSLVFYGMLACILYRLLFKKGRRLPLTLLNLLLVLMIVLIGWSRIYLGVHYATDIAGGYVAGGIWLYVCSRFLHKLQMDKRSPKLKH